MEHVDEEQLTLLAFGADEPDPRTRGHLDTCARCQAGLAGLRTTVELGRDTAAEAEEAPPPPAGVWAGILAEVQADSAASRAVGAEPALDAEYAGPAELVVPSTNGRNPMASRTIVGDPASPPVRVLPTRSRWWTALVAAAACLAGVLIGGVAVTGLRQDDGPAAPATVAMATLRPLAGTPSDAQGAASVVRVGDRLELRLDARNLPLRDGFYEVWLFDPATNQMQSMGILDPGHTVAFPIPAGLDIARYPGVDISAEQFDGRPEHSAVSVLRGRLGR